MVILLILIGFLFAQELPQYGQTPIIQEEIKRYQDLKPSELMKIVIERDKKNTIRLMQKGLSIATSQKLPIKKVNFFYFHHSLPVLFEFDKKIDKVILFSSGGKALYQDNLLVVLPPSPEITKFLGITVIFKDNTAVQLIGERVNPLYEKEKLIPYYYLYTPKRITVDNVLEAFLKKYKRCPKNGERVIIEGRTFIFQKSEDDIINADNEVYACGSVFKIIAF